MEKLNTLLVTTGLLLLFLVPTVFGVREIIPLQGKILNGTTLVSSGQINVSIFAGIGVAGTALYTENFTAGNLSNGFFNLLLGNNSDISTLYRMNYTRILNINGVRFVDTFQSTTGNITSEVVQDNNITTTDIQDRTIASADIAGGAINSSLLAFSSINASHILYKAINATHIDFGVINSSHIGFQQINASLLGFSIVNASHITYAAINSTHIAYDTLNTSHIINSTIRPDDFNVSRTPNNGEILAYNSTYNIFTWGGTASTLGNITGGGSLFYVPRWMNGSHLAGGIITDNGTYVGINTTSPNATFAIDGNATISQNFTVDSTTFFVDSSTNRIGIGTTNPTDSIFTTGAISWTNAQSGSSAVSADGTVGPWLAGYTNGGGTSSLNNIAGRISLGGDGVILSTSPATTVGSARTWTTRLLIEPDGDTGIGDTGPLDAFVDILNSGSGASFRIDDSTDNEATPFLVDADGTVGIGTATPIGKLNVDGRFNATGVGYLGNLSIAGGTNITNQTSTNATLDFGATAGATCDEANVTINGARITDTIVVGAPPSAFTAAGDKNSIFGAYTYVANTVTVRRCNFQAGALTDIPSDGFRLSVWSHY